MSPGARRRLEFLRDFLRYDAYALEEDSRGTDSSGRVEVQIDPTDWVVDIDVASLPDEWREARTLGAAVREAYDNARVQRLLENGRLRRVSDAELSSARALMEGRRRVGMPELTRVVRPSSVAGALTRPSPPLAVTDAHRVLVGTSRDHEVTVRASRTNGLAGVEIDEGWLSGTDPDLPRFAFKEAFADAYEQGEEG